MKKNYGQYNQWTALLAIARASFRSITRNPSAVIFTLGFPMVFIVVFGFIGGNRIRMEVGIDPASDTTGFVYRSFVQIPNVKIVSDKSSPEMVRLLDKGRLDAILKISRDSTGSQRSSVEIGRAHV